MQYVICTYTKQSFIVQLKWKYKGCPLFYLVTLLLGDKSDRKIQQRYITLCNSVGYSNLFKQNSSLASLAILHKSSSPSSQGCTLCFFLEFSDFVGVGGQGAAFWRPFLEKKRNQDLSFLSGVILERLRGEGNKTVWEIERQFGAGLIQFWIGVLSHVEYLDLELHRQKSQGSQERGFP